MALLDSVKAFYSALEAKYYSFMEFLQEKLRIPAVKFFVEPIEKLGVPSFPFFVLLLLVIGFGLFSLLQPQQSSLQFIVTAGGQKIDGARVELYSGSEFVDFVVTEKDGVAEFKNLKPGSFTAKIKKAGFPEVTRQVSAVGFKSVPVSLQSASKEPVTVTVKFFDTKGKPLEGVELAYAPKSDSGSAQTNALGVAKIKVPKGTSIAVKASKDGFSSQDFSFLASTDSAKEFILKELSSTGQTLQFKEGAGSVRVLVTSKVSGSVINGALVKLIDAKTKDVLKSKETSFGIALFEDVELGKAVLAYVDAEGFAPASSEETSVQETTSITFKLEKGAFAAATIVCVSDDKENEVTDADVSVVSSVDLVVVSSAKTQDDGCVSFVKLQAGSSYYAIVASAEHVLMRSELFTGGSQPKIKVLAATPENSGFLKVTVQDDQQRKIPGASVALFDGSGAFLMYPAKKTSAAGRADFLNLPLNSVFRIAVSSGSTQVSATTTIDSSTKEVSATLPSPSATLFINVTDAETGAPIENAQGFAFSERVGSNYSESEAYASCTGSLCVLSVRANAVSKIFVKAAGYLDYSFTQPATLNAGEQAAADARLTPEEGAKLVARIEISNFDAVSKQLQQLQGAVNFRQCVSASVSYADGSVQQKTFSSIGFSSPYAIQQGVISSSGRAKFFDDACQEGAAAKTIRILGYSDPVYKVSDYVKQAQNSISFRATDRDYCADLEVELLDGSKLVKVAQKIQFDGSFSLNEAGVISVAGGRAKFFDDYCNSEATAPKVKLQFKGLFDRKGKRVASAESGKAYDAKFAITTQNALGAGVYFRFGDEKAAGGAILDFRGMGFRQGGKTFDLSCTASTKASDAPFQWAEISSPVKKEGETKEVSFRVVPKPVFGDFSVPISYRGYGEKFGLYYRAPPDEQLGVQKETAQRKECLAAAVSETISIKKAGVVCDDDACISLTLSQPPRIDAVDGMDKQRLAVNSIARCIHDGKIGKECENGALLLDYSVRLFRKGDTSTMLQVQLPKANFASVPAPINLQDADEVATGTISLLPVLAGEKVPITLALARDRGEETSVLKYDASVVIEGEEIIPGPETFNLTQDVSFSVERGQVKINVPSIRMQVDNIFPADRVPLSTQTDNSCSLFLRIESSSNTKDCYSLSPDYTSLEFKTSETNPACPIKAAGDSIKGDNSASLVVSCGGVVADKKIPINVEAKKFTSLFVKPASLSGQNAKIFHIINQKQLGTRVLDLNGRELAFEGSNAVSMVMTGSGEIEIQENEVTFATLQYSSQASFYDFVDGQGGRVTSASNEYACANAWCEAPAAAQALAKFKRKAREVAKATAFRRDGLLKLNNDEPFVYSTVIRVVEGADLPEDVERINSASSLGCDEANPKIYVVRAKTTDGKNWKYEAEIATLGDASYIKPGTRSQEKQTQCFGSKVVTDSSEVGNVPLCDFLQGNGECVEKTKASTLASLEQADKKPQIIPIPSGFWKVFKERKACEFTLSGKAQVAFKECTTETAGFGTALQGACPGQKNQDPSAKTKFEGKEVTCGELACKRLAEEASCKGALIDLDFPGLLPLPRRTLLNCVPSYKIPAGFEKGLSGTAAGSSTSTTTVFNSPSSIVKDPSLGTTSTTTVTHSPFNQLVFKQPMISIDINSQVLSFVRAFKQGAKAISSLRGELDTGTSEQAKESLFNERGDPVNTGGAELQPEQITAEIAPPAETATSVASTLKASCKARCLPKMSYVFMTSCGNKLYTIIHVGINSQCKIDWKGLGVGLAATVLGYKYPEMGFIASAAGAWMADEFLNLGEVDPETNGLLKGLEESNPKIYKSLQRSDKSVASASFFVSGLIQFLCKDLG